VMKAADEFKDKTTAPNQLWQTDFTYLKVIGWGWFYLSTILDDFSRYIIAWKLCSTMKAEDVTATLDLALKASGLDQGKVIHRPRLLSDNGSSYIAADLAKWLDGQNMEHVRGAPYHPMTQGKIERWHQTLKNRILLENYYLPGDLEAQIETFVTDYLPQALRLAALMDKDHLRLVAQPRKQPHRRRGAKTSCRDPALELAPRARHRSRGLGERRSHAN
jgi:putative transposase